MMKKITLLVSLAFIGLLSSCSDYNKENALRNAAILDSIDRAYMVRDSITLDSIKKETFSRHEKRGGKIEYSTERDQQLHRRNGINNN